VLRSSLAPFVDGQRKVRPRVAVADVAVPPHRKGDWPATQISLMLRHQLSKLVSPYLALVAG
jgi:hypothetical protein